MPPSCNRPTGDESLKRPRALGSHGASTLAAILLLCPVRTFAQCALKLTISGSKACGAIVEQDKLLPEDGYLDNSSYTSVYFGFSLDLPITSDRHRITIPVMLEKQHALLAIGFQQEDRFGTLTITAEESARELAGYSDVRQEQCHEAIAALPQAGHPVPGSMLRYGEFYANLRRTGRNHTHHYWTRIRNYIIRVAVDSNDPDFLDKTKHALMDATFYCTRHDGKLLTSEGKVAVPKGEPYDGPTVPTWRADAAIKDPPGLRIPAGEIREGVYRNPSLGLQYELPEGWEILQTEVGREPPEDARELREYQLLHSCSRTLLHAAPRMPGDAEQQASRPEIVLQALDPSCLFMRMPVAIGDKKAADEMVANLELFSEFGEIRSQRISLLSNRLFVVLHGTIGQHGEDDALARRMSEALFATRDHDLLLLWSLMAPTSAELQAMPVSTITFDDSRPVQLPPLDLPMPTPVY